MHSIGLKFRLPIHNRRNRFLNGCGVPIDGEAGVGYLNKIDLHYTRADGAQSPRTVWPLGLFFWGSVRTLNAWRELRDDFRNFRLDRINALSVSDQIFEEMPGRTLADFLRTVGCNDGILQIFSEKIYSANRK
jgi:predicted DNA-binding transcriptional regulator YafY